MIEHPATTPRLRLPFLPTLLVGLAVLIMIGLGIWQLQRSAEKTAAIAMAASNPARPAVSFPALPPVPRDLLFRPSSVMCLRVAGWRTEAGRASDGTSGYRYIAQCVTGAEGPGALVVMGVTPRPDAGPVWTGGRVAGWLSEEPDHRPLIARLAGKAPPLRPMLVARTAAAGLKPAAPPSAADVPNNHLAYAVQWFLFAAIAIIIYILALRRHIGLKSA
ncbi:SURF1 family protein [Sphingobium sp. AN641]|uniref:SURF1 family protein n=1 Tax=Sphingobium sp. AN641 TaxID=3133443 RepID=UPI0030C0469D